MPPKDISAWMKNFANSVNNLELLQLVHANSYYTPKKTFNEQSQIFYIYVQPVLITFLIIWLAISVKLIWSKNFAKQYGLMTAYVSLDIVAFILQDVLLVIFLSREETYIPYDWCYAFEAFTVHIPGCLYMVTIWLKLAQAIRVFVILYKPLHTQSFLSKHKICVYILLVSVCACAISVGIFKIQVNFEKTILLDKSTGEFVEVCRDENYFKNSHYTEASFTVQVAGEIYRGILPCILMIFLTVGTIYLLKKHQNIRKNLNQQQTNRQESDERLAKVTIAASVTYTIVVLPSLPIFVIVFFKLVSRDMLGVLEILSIMHTAFVICNVPITFMLYNWLSKDYRETVLRLKKRLCF